MSFLDNTMERDGARLVVLNKKNNNHKPCSAVHRNYFLPSTSADPNKLQPANITFQLRGDTINVYILSHCFTYLLSFAKRCGWWV